MATIHVHYHREPEGWWADSPDVPDWTATAETLSELLPLVEEGVRFALDRDDLDFDHGLDYYESAKGALVTFDFIAGRTTVSPEFSHEESREGAHWEAQPA